MLVSGFAVRNELAGWILSSVCVCLATTWVLGRMSDGLKTSYRRDSCLQDLLLVGVDQVVACECFPVCGVANHHPQRTSICFLASLQLFRVQSNSPSSGLLDLSGILSNQCDT